MEKEVCEIVDEFIKENIRDNMKKYINMPLFRDDLIRGVLKSIEDWKQESKEVKYLDEIIDSNINFIFVNYSYKRILRNITDIIYQNFK